MTYKLTNTSQPADPYYGAVKLLLHGDGADGSTEILDSSLNPKTVTPVGNAQISTTQSKFNGSSLKFDGTGDYATIPDSADFYLPDDFTIEGWVYPTSNSGFRMIVAQWRDQGGSDRNFSLDVAGTFYMNRAGTNQTVSLGAFSLNQWTHFAVAVENGTCYGFINGVLQDSNSNFTAAANNSTEPLGIGAYGNGDYVFAGYIDDLRITKGVARYTSNFTPPTQPFLNTSNIVINGLVLNLDAAAYGGSGTTWSDSSGNGNTGTLVNGVGYDSGNEGSLTFDGVNDYVTLSSSQIAPGTGAFTWNFWAKHIPTGSGVGRYSILFSGTGSNSTYGVIYMNSDTGLGYYALGHRILDSNPAFNDEWWHIAFVGNGGPNGARTLKLYRNGVQAGSTYTYNYSFTSTTPLIGANHSSFAELMRGNISNVLYYNRELTESEIQQNYSALKGRFGL